MDPSRIRKCNGNDRFRLIKCHFRIKTLIDIWMFKARSMASCFCSSNDSFNESKGSAVVNPILSIPNRLLSCMISSLMSWSSSLAVNGCITHNIVFLFQLDKLNLLIGNLLFFHPFFSCSKYFPIIC